MDSVVNASSFFSPCRLAVCRRNELKKNNRGRQVCGAPAQTTQASARQRPATQKARRARPTACGEAKKRNRIHQTPRCAVSTAALGQARCASILRLWGRTELQRDGFDALPSSHSPKPARAGWPRRLRPDCPARARQSREFSPEILPLRLRKVGRPSATGRRAGLGTAKLGLRPKARISFVRRRFGLTACAAYIFRGKG